MRLITSVSKLMKAGESSGGMENVLLGESLSRADVFKLWPEMKVWQIKVLFHSF